MDEAEIKKIIAATLDELHERKLLDYKDLNLNYMYMSKKIHEHYNYRKSKRVELSLEKIRDDKYFDIIPLYYRDNMTLDKVAQEFYCDYSTIVRNKKRLVLKVLELEEEEK